MSAPLGNKFWKMANHSGQNLAFDSPEELWDKAQEYFQWCDDNPFKEEKLFHFQGTIVRDTVSKMRAYTQRELCLFLGVNEKYLSQFNEDKAERNKEYANIVTRIRDVIYTQKFTGAAADLLNPSLIAKEIGLSDKHLHGQDPENPLPTPQTQAVEVIFKDFSDEKE